jgi:single-strand DNA-binding protein
MDGIPMTKFKLAVARPFGGTDFIDVIAWRQVAEACSDHLKKGRLALVEGRIQIRAFEDQAGQRRWATEVVARNVQMFDKSPALPAGRQVGGDQAAVEETVGDADLAGDLPF